MTNAVDGWIARDLPPSHYLDNRIYADEEIFALERDRIFAATWKFVCCTGELPETGDFRLATVAGRQLIVVRGDDAQLRTFVNVCVHRGARLIREPAGRLVNNTINCFYHLWSYDSRGQCITIPQHDGYAASGLKPEQVSLQAVRTEELFGLVFVCLDDEVEPLVDFLGSEIVEELRGPFADAEFEVFHLHRAELAANWKLFVETNAEGYHELLHLLNRTTAVGVKEYRNRRWHVHRNGHLVFEHAAIGYDRLDLGARDENLLPGMLPNGHLVVDLFPDMMLNCRSTVLRIDSLTPIAPGRTLLECRGLGLKGDPPDVRRQRVAQHNQVWGPMGRNLPEDIWAVETQWRNMASGASAFSMIAREENLGPMDDATLRAFYAEWQRKTGRQPHDIDAPSASPQP